MIARNNIVYKNSQRGNSTFENNLVGGSTTLIILKDSGREIKNIKNRNPFFVNPASGDFRLSPNSPAIDSGMTLGEVLKDFRGVARPRGPASDIGAYEY